MSEQIFVLLPDKAEWEDLIIFTDETDAMIALKKSRNKRVEIFKKGENGSFLPSYDHYTRIEIDTSNARIPCVVFHLHSE